VAYGAAVQASVLSGERDKRTQELLLLDVIPLTLGIETTGGVMGVVLPRNTVVPAQKSKVYTTSEDNQVAVNNRVFEGERSMTKDNRLLGAFELSGFPPMAKGRAQIEVTFDVDANGILSVSAVETTSGKKAQITIKNDDRLSDEAIDRMVRDAEQYKEEDERALRRVEARNALESYVHRAKSALRDVDLRGQMSEDDVDAVQAELRSVEEWIDANDATEASEFETVLERLTQEAVGPVLSRYGAEGFTDAGAFGGDGDDFEYTAAEHEEL